MIKIKKDFKVTDPSLVDNDCEAMKALRKLAISQIKRRITEEDLDKAIFTYIERLLDGSLHVEFSILLETP